MEEPFERGDQRSQGQSLLPVGRYAFTVAHVAWEHTKAGNLRVATILRVHSGTYTGQRIWTGLFVSLRTLPFVLVTLRVLGWRGYDIASLDGVADQRQPRVVHGAVAHKKFGDRTFYDVTFEDTRTKFAPMNSIERTVHSLRPLAILCALLDPKCADDTEPPPDDLFDGLGDEGATPPSARPSDSTFGSGQDLTGDIPF